MDASHLVTRMLSSLSASIPTATKVDKYLQVFGVTSQSKDLPIVFDQQYTGVWKAIISDSKFLNKDPKLRQLLTILNYIKFMRSQKLNPFVVTNGKTLNSLVRPVDMEKEVIKSEVQETYATVLTYLRKTGVTSYLKVSKRTVQLSLNKSVLLVNFLFVPIRKDSLEKVLNYNLKGLLYRSAIPLQLQTQLLTNTKSFTTIITTLHTSATDWLPLTSINNFKVFVRSTKDGLAIRVQIPVDSDYTPTTRDLQNLVTLWKTVK